MLTKQVAPCTLYVTARGYISKSMTNIMPFLFFQRKKIDVDCVFRPPIYRFTGIPKLTPKEK